MLAITWNVKGLASPNKHKLIFNIIKNFTQKKPLTPIIWLLQETHSNSNDEQKWRFELGPIGTYYSPMAHHPPMEYVFYQTQ